MTRRPLLLLLLLALLLPTQHAASQDGPIVFEPTPRLNVFRSKHYRIFTTLSRTETLPYGRHMDAIYGQYERRFRGLGGQQVEPMPLYLFKTEQQYDRFLQEHDIDATHSGGMFFVTHKLEGLATWAEAGQQRKTFEVLQHEGFHQFAWHAFGARLPVWLNEGLAQYFENAVLTDGRLSLGMARSARVQKVGQALQDDTLMPVRQVLGLTSEDWGRALRRDPDHASLLYAQAWSLTYFLIHGDGGVHKPKLMDYLQRLGEGEPSDNAELMAFGPSGVVALEGNWRAFAGAQQPDEVTVAADRLAFLGTGLRVLAEQGADMPADLEALRTTLQRYGFKLRKNELGVTREYSSQHAELYRYTRSDRGERAFVLLEPDHAGLPPGITAPGLDPEPTLVWSRDSDGELVHEIAYR